MTRRRHSRVPGVAKLASGILIAGVSLGLLLAAAVNPVMKYPAENWWSSPERTDSTAQAPSLEWGPDAPMAPQAIDSFRPDFDYDEVVGAEWALPEAEARIEAEPLPPLEEAFKAADDAAQAAAAAREAAAQPPAEAEGNVPAGPFEDGLY